MKRTDLYILALAVFHLVLFFGVMSVISAGAGLTLIGERSWVGSASIALFAAAFLGIFYNLSRLVPVIALSDEERSLAEIVRASRVALLILAAYTLIEFLQALSYFSMYQTQ